MTRWKLRNKFNVGSYYIGSGNRSDVFTRKSRVAFEDIRDTYDTEKKPENNSVKQRFTIGQIEKFKQDWNIRMQQENRWKLIKRVVAVIISLAFLYLLYELFFLLLDFIEDFKLDYLDI